MNQEVKISIRAYAKQLNIDESAVRSAIKDGKIRKGVVVIQRTVNGKRKKVPMIIATVATKEWGFVHQHPRPQRGLSAHKVADKLEKKSNPGNSNNSEDPDDADTKEYSYSELIKEIKITPRLSYKEALLRKEILSTAREKMELEEKQGVLVKKADVDKALFAIGDELKKKLLSIPARCIQDIRAASNEVEANNILTIEITQSLHSISQLQSA
jgi:hypothetical protein